MSHEKLHHLSRPCAHAHNEYIDAVDLQRENGPAGEVEVILLVPSDYSESIFHTSFTGPSPIGPGLSHRGPCGSRRAGGQQSNRCVLQRVKAVQMADCSVMTLVPLIRCSSSPSIRGSHWLKFLSRPVRHKSPTVEAAQMSAPWRWWICSGFLPPGELFLATVPLCFSGAQLLFLYCSKRLETLLIVI